MSSLPPSEILLYSLKQPNAPLTPAAEATHDVGDILAVIAQGESRDRGQIQLTERQQRLLSHVKEHLTIERGLRADNPRVDALAIATTVALFPDEITDPIILKARIDGLNASKFSNLSEDKSDNNGKPLWDRSVDYISAQVEDALRNKLTSIPLGRHEGFVVGFAIDQMANSGDWRLLDKLSGQRMGGIKQYCEEPMNEGKFPNYKTLLKVFPQTLGASMERSAQITLARHTPK